MELQTLVNTYIKKKRKIVLEQIILQLKPFIDGRTRYITRLTRQSFEDTRQEMVIIIMNRLKSYERGNGISKSKFLTYLWNTTKGDSTEILKKMVRKKRGGDGMHKYLSLLSLNTIIGVDDNGILEYLEDRIMDKKDLRKNLDVKFIQELLQKYGKEKTRKILTKEGYIR